MDLPQPPQDTELKNIIDKLAQFVARNGPEFEQMTKTKQKDNPKFSFLFGGNYFNYYQYKVTTEQAILKHRQTREQTQPQLHQPPPQPQQMGYPPGTPAAYPPHAYPNYSYPPTSAFPGVDQGPYPPQPNVPPNNYHQSYPPLPPQQPAVPGVDPIPSSAAPVSVSPATTVTAGGPPNFAPPLPPTGATFPPGDPNYATPNTYAPPTSTTDVNFSQPQPAPAYPTPPDPTFGGQPPPNAGDVVYTTAGAFPPQPPLPPNPSITLESLGQQQMQLQEQIKQSEQNLSAQQQVLDQQKESQIREGIYVARGEVLRSEATDLGLNPNELQDLLTPITESCTKDSISNGKHWIFTNAISAPNDLWISRYLLYKATNNAGPFTHKLHIIYLMNDVLHHCVRKNAEDLKEALQKVLAPMFCHAMTIASDDQKVKLDKLLSLWESKIKLESLVVEQLRVPAQSWGEFEKDLIAEFPQVVTTINSHIDSTFEGYQQQHNAFVQHATSQIQQIDQQRQQIEHQQAATTAAVTAALPSSPFTPPSGPQPPPPQAQQIPGPPSSVAALSQNLSQALDFNQPPPGFPPGPGLPPLVDFSKPPPGFMMEEQKENLVPTVPYFELPAGLMAPLVRNEDHKYRPLDPCQLRLPPPTPPSDRLLQAVENFYLPPSHERPRNSEGWEQLALYDYYKAKSQAIKNKETDVEDGIRDKSRSPSPVTIEPPPEEEYRGNDAPVRRYRSASPEPPPKLEPPPEMLRKSPSKSPDPRNMASMRRSRSRSRSNSRSPRQRRSRSPRRSRSRSMSSSPRRSRSRSISRSRSRSRSKSRTRSRSRSSSRTPPRIPYKRSPSRSPSPPSFLNSSYTKPDHRLDENNKGHQMLRKMGWGGLGLGAKEQGISDPIAAADPRDSTASDRFRGLGIPSSQNDPYEAFRKNKGQAFINRMKARAEEKKCT